MLKNLSTALVVLAAVVCLAAPSHAAVRSIDIGLSDNRQPSIDEGQVAWSGWDGTAWQVYLFDGSIVYQLTHDQYDSGRPMIRRGRIAWRGNVGGKWQIFYFNGYETRQLTNYLGDQQNPCIDDAGNVVWAGYDVSCGHEQIFFYDASNETVTRLSDGTADCEDPAISQGQVVWLQPLLSVSKKAKQLYFYNGGWTRVITNRVVGKLDYRKGAKGPDISEGEIVWQGRDAEGRKCWNIYLYQSQDDTIQQIISEPKTLRAFNERRPCIDDGKIVWESKASGIWDLYYSYYSNGVRRSVHWSSPSNDLKPVIRNKRTCWLRKDAGASQIIARDGGNNYGGSEFAVSGELVVANQPDIDRWGRIVWRQFEEGRWVIMLFDGTNPMQLTRWSSNQDNQYPEVHNGQVVWQRKDGEQLEIYLWNGISSPTAITNDGGPNKFPSIYDGVVCWLKQTKGVAQVFVWRDGQEIPVTDSAPTKQNARIYGDQLVWQQYVGNDAGIYSCQVPTIEHITDDSLDHREVHLDHGQAAWAEGDPAAPDTWEIKLWDGLDIIPLTSNGYEDRNPHLRNGRVVWQGRTNGYWQIWLYNGTGQPVQLTPNTDYDNINPLLDDEGRVVWQGQSNGNWQIFMFDGSSIRQLTSSSGLDNTDPAISEGQVAWRGQIASQQSGNKYFQAYVWAEGLSEPQRLTYDAANISPPHIDGGRVTWTAKAGVLAESVYYWYWGRVEPALITTAYYGCTNVQLANPLIVWEQYDGSHSQIYYGRTDEVDENGNWVVPTPKQLTGNQVNDTNPVTDGTHIVWCREEDGSRHIHISDGINTVKLTDYDGNNFSPSVSDSQVLWLEDVAGTWQVRGWLPVHTLLSNPDYSSSDPAISFGGHVAWECYDGFSTRIYHWNGITDEPLSAAGYDAYAVAVDGAQAAWEESDGVTRQIIYYDGFTPRVLDTPPVGPDDSSTGGPKLHQGRVVWSAWDGNDYEIYLFDGLGLYQMTNNDVDDTWPRIDHGQIVWKTWDGNDSEIMFWDGTATYTLTVNEWTDDQPQLDKGLVVWEGHLNNSWQIFTWKWQGRPLFEPILDQSVECGEPVEFEVKATDPNGDPLTFSASGKPLEQGWASFDPETRMFSWPTAFGQEGVYRVFFTATDNSEPPQTTTQVVQITVGYVNVAPQFDPMDDLIVKAGIPMSFPVAATDINGENLEFPVPPDLPAGADFDPATATFTWTPEATQLGEHVVTFSVIDDGTPPLSDTMQVRITVGDNEPPVLNEIGDRAVSEGAVLTFPVSATDPDDPTGAGLTFSADNLPETADFNEATHVFTWQPEIDQSGTYVGVHFKVTDSGVPQGIDEEYITIRVANLNFAPTIQTINDISVYTGDPIDFYVVGSDPDNDQLTYSILDPVPGVGAVKAKINQNTGRFTWAPNYTCIGTWPVTVKVTEVHPPKVSNSTMQPLMDPDTGEVVGDAYPWVMTGTYASQTLSNPPGVDAQLDLTYDFLADSAYASQVGIYNVTDGTWVDTPHSVQGSGAWQQGLSHLVTIAEQDVGDELEVRFYGTGTVAYDNVSCKLHQLSATEPFTITVEYINNPPSIAPIPNKVVNWGNEVTFVVQGYDPNDEPIDITCDSLPEGANFDPSPTDPEHKKVFSWIPTYEQYQQYHPDGCPLTFRVTDTGTPPASGSEDVTIFIGDNHPPVIDPPALQPVDPGHLLEFPMTGSDPDGDSLATWKCYGWKLNPDTGQWGKASLPAGAKFDEATATFTWTPGYNQNGTYDWIRFEATDDGLPPMSATLDVTIVVNYINMRPQFYQTPDQSAHVGELLTFTVVATDPNGETVTYTVGNKPQYAEFDGATGTFTWVPRPEQTGTFPPVKFTATDTGSPPGRSIWEVTISVGSYRNVPPELKQVGNIDQKLQSPIDGAVGQQMRFPVKATDRNIYNMPSWEENVLTYTAEALYEDEEGNWWPDESMWPDGAQFALDVDGIWYFTWTPTEEQVGDLRVRFTVTDSGHPRRSISYDTTLHISPAP